MRGLELLVVSAPVAENSDSHKVHLENSVFFSWRRAEAASKKPALQSSLHHARLTLDPYAQPVDRSNRTNHPTYLVLTNDKVQAPFLYHRTNYNLNLDPLAYHYLYPFVQSNDHWITRPQVANQAHST